MSSRTKFLTMLALVLLALGVWFYTSGRASTTVDLTLTTNPDLEDDLVGHWTFDGEDVDWSSTTAEIRDRSGQGNHGNAQGGMTANTSSAMGAISQGLQFDGGDDYLALAGTTGAASPTFDATNLSVIATDPLSGASTAHTVPSGTDLLVVMLQGWTVGDADPPTAVTWNGSNLSRVDLSSTCGGSLGWAADQHGLWYLANPTPGTAGTLAIEGGDLSITDGGIAHIVNLSNVDLGTGTSGMVDCYGIKADSYTTVTLAPTTAEDYLLLTQWSQQADAGTTGQTYGGTSGAQTVRDGTAWNGDGAFLTTSLPTGSSQNVTFLGKTGSTYPSGLSLSVAGDTLAGGVNDVQSVSFWVKPDTTTEPLINLNNSANIDVLSGTVRANSYSGATIYVDGVQTTTFPDTGWHHVTVTNTTATSATAFQVGKVGSSYFGGSLDDVRIYSRALSADEVQRLYELGATTRIAETITTNPDLETGLVGHWTFDGNDVDWSSTTAEIRDRSIVARHGNATTSPVGSGDPFACLGVIGQALCFDTAGDITMPGFTEWSSGNGSVELGTVNAVATWLYVVDEDLQTVFGNASWPSPLRIDPGVNGNDLVGLQYRLGAESYEFFADQLQLNEWHHIAFLRNGAFVDLYVDGAYVETHEWTTQYAEITQFNRIGSQSLGVNHYTGSLDDVRIYERALSAEEVKRLYELGATTRVAETITTNPDLETGLVGHWTFDGADTLWASSAPATSTDRSGNDNHGTIYGAQPTIGVVGQGMRFPAVNNLIDVGTALDVASLPLTVSAWVNPSSFTTYGTIFSKRDSYASNDMRFNLMLCDSAQGQCTGEGTVLIQNGTAGVESSVAVSVSEWTLLTTIMTADGIEIYFDGILQETLSALSLGTDASAATRIGGVGIGVGNGQYYGSLDDVRIYNRALSADEVRRLYEMGR